MNINEKPYEYRYICAQCSKKMMARDAAYSLKTFGVIACNKHVPDKTLTGFKNITWNNAPH